MSSENNERQKVINIEQVFDRRYCKNRYINRKNGQEIKLYNKEGFEVLPDISKEKYIVVSGWSLLNVILTMEEINGDVFYSEETSYIDQIIDINKCDDVIKDNYEDFRYCYFIVENLGNGYYREVMSGITFQTGHNNRMSAEQLQKSNRLNELIKNPLIMSLIPMVNIKEEFRKFLKGPYQKTNDEAEKIVSSECAGDEVEDFTEQHFFAYKLDTTFKEYYAKEMLPKKDIIIKFMTALEQLGKSMIKESADLVKEKMHSNALVDNLLYDYEHNNIKR